MRVLIVGNGIAGVTTAQTLRQQQAHAQITLISQETKFFFARTALMYRYMGQLSDADLQPYEAHFWKENRIELCFAQAQAIDPKKQTLRLSNGQTLAYDFLVLALGSQPNTLLNLPLDGSLPGIQGLYHWQDLQNLEAYTPKIKQAAIVGGGLIGVELAEMLCSRQIPVHLILRESAYWANQLPLPEAQMISQHLEKQGVMLHHGHTLASVELENQSLKSLKTQQGLELPVNFLGLSIGVRPNLSLLEQDAQKFGIECDQGILVDAYLQTSQANIYALGDCAQLRQPAPQRKSVEALWYTARNMGLCLGHTLAGQPQAYQPGLWFNSAKFFEVEYQAYGQVQASLPADSPSAQLHWQDAQAEKSIRIQYHRQTLAVQGFCLLGIRYRQEVCHAWIEAQTPINEVLMNLELANFDAEFSKMYELQLRQVYENQTGQKLPISAAKRNLWAVFKHFGRKRL